ncbi:DUF421 domain-containing protein [Fulvimarina sp. 2208YS6-2-32]|uniref:DUF421 domain-containing protein n=1 Tax=Fulvimarina uroteuthidis TaxID=3098149 RepID=A0ABU5I3N5_9HYPH|nr:YetF domain-containing protein [Fulvimarina sp. 2208YS6-2-32]MDY8109707.1 DUF421 domain-containing protein [Fulvimarina sp. 2208YS6-2-32]
MDWSEMFFQSWSGIARTLIVGTIAYIFLVVSLRVSGKRTLAKLNAFDLIVTVALGSTLATILLSESVALAEGVTALALLIALQYAVTALSVRSERFAGVVRSEPSLLLRDGKPLHEAMRKARVTKAELDTVVRTEGQRGLEDIAAVILESDGSFSVIDGEQKKTAPHADARTGGPA